ncbi:MAG: hypothetical protein H6867_05165 [Rhodospirillales bacterium]|nr:hypothetical protein [Rhodospirillales bacterium]MCB9994918.1 hypothetical protein [Rhodospirillales bacterium]
MSEDNQEQKPEAPAIGKMDFNTTIQMLWNGNIPLAHTFWIYYFCVIVGLKVVSGIPGIGGAFYMLQLVWAGFMVKPIFVAADRYEGPSHWVLAAKAAAVIIGLWVLSALLF